MQRSWVRASSDNATLKLQRAQSPIVAYHMDRVFIQELALTYKNINAQIGEALCAVMMRYIGAQLSQALHNLGEIYLAA